MELPGRGYARVTEGVNVGSTTTNTLEVPLDLTPTGPIRAEKGMQIHRNRRKVAMS
jgi:hypothetical protein